MISYSRTKIFTEQQLGELFLSVNWVSGNQPAKLKKAFENSTAIVSGWDGDRLVGLARGLGDGVWQATIDCVLVRPEYQRQGIAQTLVQTLIDDWQDILYINVIPDEKRNVSFYEQLGFSVVPEGTLLQITSGDWGLPESQRAQAQRDAIGRTKQCMQAPQSGANRI